MRVRRAFSASRSSALSGSKKSSSSCFATARRRVSASSAGVGQPDEVPPAIGRVAAPLDQLARLEVVEQADEVAPVVAERVGDHRLRLARLLGEQREHRVVVRAEARRLVGLQRCAP